MTLEAKVAELETFFKGLKEDDVVVEESEWKTRYELERNTNDLLNEQKTWLTQELAQAEWKLNTNSFPEAMGCDLNSLSDFELLRLVRHMERLKNDFTTNVLDSEYRLKKEMEAFKQVDKVRRACKTEVKHESQAMKDRETDNLLELRQDSMTATETT